MPPTLEIAFTSYDSRLKTYLYGIKLDGKLTRKRRFREFERLVKDLLAINPAWEVELPSKFFGTAAETRKPILEAILKRALDDFGVDCAPLREFLGVASSATGVATPSPVKRKRREANKFPEDDNPPATPENRLFGSVLRSVEVLLTGVAFLTASLTTWLLNAHAERNYAVQLTGFAFALTLCFAVVTARQKSRQYDEDIRRRALLEESANEEEEEEGEGEYWNVNITHRERKLLDQLRERLQDFATPDDSTTSFEESWIKSNAKLVAGWGGKEALSRNLRDPLKRARVYQVHVLQDFRLVEMLRAQNYSLDTAEEVTRFTLTARLVLDIDDFCATSKSSPILPPAWVCEYGASPGLMRTLIPAQPAETRVRDWWLRDRDGRLCMFTRPGPINSLAILKKFKGDLFAVNKVLVWFIESFREDFDFVIRSTEGKVPGRCTLVADMEGFELANQIGAGDILPMARIFIPVLAPAYAGILHRLIVINAPWYVSSLVALIRPFVPKDIMECISIHGRSSYNLEKHILPYVDKANIPKYLGGDLVDPNGDPFCADRITPRGPYLPDKGASLLKIE